jgi:hypothetical protein
MLQPIKCGLALPHHNDGGNREGNQDDQCRGKGEQDGDQLIMSRKTRDGAPL